MASGVVSASGGAGGGGSWRRASWAQPAASTSTLLELYRNYLRVLARTQVDQALRVRVDPSDLAQETLWEAHRAFGRFGGTTERELLAWLRRLLVRNVLDAAKRHRAGRRNVGRQ